MKDMTWIGEKLERLPGNLSAVVRWLKTGETYAYRPEARHEAASVIKLFLMAALFQDFEDGRRKPETLIPVRRESCVPSCGVLTYLDDGKRMSLRDLTELMIIVSDNTACNVLLEEYTIPAVQRYITEGLGLKDTLFQRRMFDTESAARGLDNFTTAADTAWLLEEIYGGRLVSREASRQMLQMLRDQRLNGKIPFRLHTLSPAPVIAHKTGENPGTTHDVGIIEGEDPLLVCFMGNETDVPAFEREMEEIAWELYMQKG